MSKIIKSILDHLECKGFKGEIVKNKRLSNLEGELKKKRDSGVLHKELDNEYLSGFDYSLKEKHPDGSIFIVAIPQPQKQVAFTVAGQIYHLFIPPTYIHNVDDTVKDIILQYLRPSGYHLYNIDIPKKLLAVRSGLAIYGKNNITYVPGMGSFFRLCAFGTDLISPEDNWGDLRVLDNCANCKACQKICPTNAIRNDRFQIYAERCLTFYNERNTTFPDWINPDWHNCLVGCMHCQRICPVNLEFKDWVSEGDCFSEEETMEIHDGKTQTELTQDTMAKLRRLNLLDYLEQLPRNLSALCN